MPCGAYVATRGYGWGSLCALAESSTYYARSLLESERVMLTSQGRHCYHRLGVNGGSLWGSVLVVVG